MKLVHDLLVTNFAENVSSGPILEKDLEWGRVGGGCR